MQVDIGSRVRLDGHEGRVTQTDALYATVTLTDGRTARIGRHLLRAEPEEAPEAAPEAKAISGPPQDKALKARRNK
jgi:hypothetical protein